MQSTCKSADEHFLLYNTACYHPGVCVCVCARACVEEFNTREAINSCLFPAD